MRVVVLMGGTSTEREISIATGRGVTEALSARGHEVFAVDSATGEQFSLEGIEQHRIGQSPVTGAPFGDRERSLVLAKGNALETAEAVFVALHGGIGEDGTLQALLDLAGVPYTGSGMLASALAMDKALAKVMFRSSKIPTPRGRLLTQRDGTLDPESLGGFPLVIKPNCQGSSVAVHIVQKPDDLAPALDDAFKYPPVLAEEFVPGREITVAVLGGKALPVIEIIPETGFYDYRHKYTKGETRYEVPAQLAEPLAREAARLGELAFDTLGCRGVARVDFRMTEDGNLFCLEVNTIPGLTETSLVPMAAKEVGMSYEELVHRLIELAGPE